MLHDGETVILTVNQKGQASPQEIEQHKEYLISFKEGAFFGFYDSSNKALYRNPTVFCKNVLIREGHTNEWNGPMHCLVKRANTWVSLYSLFNT